LLCPGILHKEGGEKLDVAIKRPILSLSDRHRLKGELIDFYTEAKVTSNFCHENILRCLGITKGQWPSKLHIIS
jgi:hypothetical protein